MLLVSMARYEELAETAHYDVREFARFCNLSLRQLQREFKDHFHATPKKWLNEQRIRKAQRLLLEGKSVKQVAFELYFKQPSHFCRLFKTLVQRSPSQYVRHADSPHFDAPLSWIRFGCRV